MFKTYIRFITKTVAIAMAFLLPVTASAATAAGNWKSYTSFDCQPQKIIDTPRYAYFVVHQSFFSQNYLGKMFSSPKGAVLCYDKQNPGLGIVPLSDKVPLSGVEVRAAAYNPTGKYLMIIYTDGGIDVVTDSGLVKTIKGLKDSKTPFPTSTNHISFPLNSPDAWIGTSVGFIHIDGSNFTIAQKCVLERNVKAICPVGNRLLAIMDVKSKDENGNLKLTECALYDADNTRRPGGLKDFSPTGISDTKSNLDFILPVSGTVFAMLDGQTILEVSRKDNGTYTTRKTISDSLLAAQLVDANSMHYRSFVYSCNENNGLYCQDGYLLFSRSYAYYVSKGTDSAGKLKIDRKQFEKVFPVWAGTWDNATYWMYEPRKGFYTTKADAGGVLKMSGVSYIPYNGPVVMESVNFDYSPKYGMMARYNDGTWIWRTNNGSNIPLLLCGLKNGKWSNYSPAFSLPKYCEGNASLTTSIQNGFLGTFAYPLSNSTGGCFDPEFPDYYYAGSVFQGLSVMNLSNVDGEIMRFGAVNSKTQNASYMDMPGFVKLFPDAGYSSYCNPRVLGADGDGNIWVYYCDALTYTPEGLGISLYCWTKDARRRALETQDVKNAGEWKKLFYPTATDHNSARNIGLALKHPKNKNKIIVCSTGTRNYIIVIDHAGTLDTTADDKVFIINTLSSDSWGDLKMDGVGYSMSHILENPETGEIVFTTLNGVYTLDLSSPMENGKAKGGFLSVKGENSRETAVGMTSVTGIAFDEYNRLWVAVENEGIKCLNADRTEIVAEYDGYNSPLPSLNFFDLCWNPETKELMVSTSKGLVSVQPDVRSTGTSMNLLTAPYLWPAAVDPASASVVTLYNAPETSAIEILNTQQERICSLKRDNGLYIWNLKDEYGNPVPEGTYTFTDRTENMEPLEINVLR